MAWCLPKNLSTDFKQKLKDGSIDPAKLAVMSSEDRHAFFKSFLGEDNATQVNSQFESKLLLKNQQKGMVTWAKKVSGITPQVRSDLISKIGKMDQVLNPTDQSAFLKDLASTKIGTNVSLEEAQKLANLSSKVQQAKSILQEDITNKAKQLDYGRTIYDIQKHLDEIRPTSLSTLNKIGNIANAPRALVASLDYVSAPFRHGWGAMTDPAWIKNFANIPRLLVSEGAYRDTMAKIYGDPNYDALVKGGLRVFKTTGDLSKQEEEFASNLINKVPIFGGMKQASQRGYTGFLNKLRFDMANSMLKGGELRGRDISVGSKYVKDVSTFVNNFTGAGSLGRFESAVPALNGLFFSPRLQVARFNMFNPLNYLNPKIDPMVRTAMMKNLIGSLAVSASALTLAQLAGAKIEWNPNATNFGQIQLGNMKIDVTGGNRVFAILLSRLISGQYVSSAGKVTQLGQGAYKPLTRMDLVNSWIKGRLTPGAASMLSDLWSSTNGKDEFGQPMTLSSELKKQFIPLNITNGMDLYNNDPSNSTLGIVLGLFGIPVSSTAPIAPKSSAKSSGIKFTGAAPRSKTGGIKFK